MKVDEFSRATGDEITYHHIMNNYEPRTRQPGWQPNWVLLIFSVICVHHRSHQRLTNMNNLTMPHLFSEDGQELRSKLHALKYQRYAGTNWQLIKWRERDNLKVAIHLLEAVTRKCLQSSSCSSLTAFSANTPQHQAWLQGELNEVRALQTRYRQGTTSVADQVYLARIDKIRQSG
jgi:hypothetical protein